MKYTDEDLLDELREATKEQEREVTYDFFNQRKGPSSRTLELRFDTFTRAKSLAGVSEKGYAGKQPVNSSFFSKIDSDESAYWLGVLYGDGWITEEKKNDKLALGLIDKGHVKKFKDSLSAGHSITEHDKKEENSTWRLTVADQQLVDDLVAHGCGKDKTHSDSLPDIENQYHAAFVRGLFDADGHYQERGTTFFITGACRGRLEKLVDWLPCQADVSEGERKHYLRVAQHHGVESLWNWLYPDGIDTEPALQRKKKLINDKRD
jgi:hypothetical protein